MGNEEGETEWGESTLDSNSPNGKKEKYNISLAKHGFKIITENKVSFLQDGLGEEN